MIEFVRSDFYLSNRKFERLGGLLGEKVTVSVHKTLPDATSECHWIREIGNQCHAGLLY